MAVKDNREFIARLEDCGELVKVKEEVDWDLEMAAITRRLCETKGPAALFENIRDYPGHRCLAAPLASFKRFAIAMGLAPDTPYSELRNVYSERINKCIPPKVVDTGPCKENIVRGDDVDIFEFPIPMVHDGDGGRYLGTWAFEVSKDPETDWYNWGVYRVMACDERHVTCMTLPPRHVTMHLNKYKAENRGMPIAIVVGGDPISTAVASFDIGVGESEVEYAGALLQEPVELVKCETCDLLVPARAEIVVEGEMLPDVTIPEGPFGEFTGYRSGMQITPLIRINAITYRDDPIFTLSNMGLPFHESSLRGLARELKYEEFFRSLGIPVTAVHIPPEFSEMVIVVSVKTTHGCMAMRVKDAFNAWRPTTMHKIIVVDEDVDVFNLNEVLHAFATKCHPIRGIKAFEEYVIRLVPALSDQERSEMKGAVGLFDCTWPIEWPKDERPSKIAFSTYPKHITDKILANWHRYGFGS